ncbi:MAG: heparan-alpha-glucosaminide N-acetyltransferase domain-containing protein [Candidatus Hermodarchaeota archaeon]
MARLNSIDTIRGLSMWFMIYGHMLDWWIFPVDTWFRDLLYAFLEPICATGFLFVSGISATLSLRSSTIKGDFANSKIIKYSYFFRAFFILLIGFMVNFFSLLMLEGSIFDLWSWQVLQTIGFSLIFSWPFRKRSILFRIILGLIFIIANQVILILLASFSGQANLFGVLFHFLFNPLSQYIILVYFGIFLIGTAIGEQIFIFNTPKSKSEKLDRFKSEFYKKYLLFGAISMGFGLIFAFPDFLYLNTISSIMFSLGFILVLMSLLISKDLSEKIKSAKSYRYLYFYSYYSFTIYLGHYAVYSLFLDQLNWIVFIFLVFGVFNAITTFLLRTMYVKVGNKLSLKTGINTLSSMLATKLVKRMQNKSIILLKDK